MCIVVGNLEDLLQAFKLLSETFEIKKKIPIVEFPPMRLHGSSVFEVSLCVNLL